MTEESAQPAGAVQSRAAAVRDAAWDTALVGCLVFCFALLGILTRPSGALAAFWPANAVLLGVLLRRKRPATVLTWCGAAVGYMLADLCMGGAWPKVAWLSAANLAGAITGYLLYMRLPSDHRRLKQPLSVVYMAVIVVAASLAAGLVGMVINPMYFGGTAAEGMLVWFSSELVDYLVILPVFLTLPARRRTPRNRRRDAWWRRVDVLALAPALTLFLGGLLGIFISGPGAVSYLVPGLLWCALAYSLFTTALLNLLCSIWTLLAVSAGYLLVGSNFDGQHALQSFRIGVALMILAPLAVASVMAARNELLCQLQHSATHDRLTGVLNRAGFLDQAGALLGVGKGGVRAFAALMIDVDHFKRINDSHGHAAGDQVLSQVATVLAQCLRDTDLLGRMGGEEFAVLLTDGSHAAAQVVAARICSACAAHTTVLADGTPLVATVSIGVVLVPADAVSVDVLLSAADHALYRAKHAGRNRFVVGELPPPAEAV